MIIIIIFFYHILYYIIIYFYNLLYLKIYYYLYNRKMNKFSNFKPKYINKSLLPRYNNISYKNIIKSNNILNNLKNDSYLSQINNKYKNIYSMNKRYFSSISSIDNKEYKKYNNNPYKYNFVFGGLCGMFLITIYDENNKHNFIELNLYPTNFIYDFFNRDYKDYIIGFIVGGLCFPISYSLVAASILFNCMKKII